MDISKIDKNFVLPGAVQRDDIVWMNTSQAPVKIYGAVHTDPYLRMPFEVARTVNEGVEYLCGNTAGIRARFRTDSPYIAIHAEWGTQCRMSHMTTLGICGFDLYRVSDRDGKQSYVKSFTPPVSCENGYESIVETGEGMAEYVLNFPLYNGVSELWIGVKKDSRWDEAGLYNNSLPVVFYGSSITQGGCASRPGTCYQNFLSRALNMDYVNLGFSGHCRAEDSMIEYLADLKMSVFVSDYDHNAPNSEHLKATHERLYRAIRKKHSDIPYIIVSKPDYRYNEEDRARLDIVTATYLAAVAEGDKNVYFLDGRKIFEGDERDACTVDGCHPNDLGFYRFSKALESILKRCLD